MHQQSNRNTGQQYNSGPSGQSYQSGPSSFTGFDDNYQTPVDGLIEATTAKLDALYQARQGFIVAEQMEQGFTNWSPGNTFQNSPRRGNYPNQGFRPNNPNISGGGGDASDGRTTAGRMAGDADDISPDELMGYLENAERNQDESVDLRTQAGRALKAAGWVDEDGFEIPGTVQQFSRQGSRGGRKYSGQPSNSRR